MFISFCNLVYFYVLISLKLHFAVVYCRVKFKQLSLLDKNTTFEYLSHVNFLKCTEELLPI